MIEAAPLFEGEHDFTAFAAADDTDTLRGSRVRTIFRSTLSRQERTLTYSVTGSGFLKHMVRNIVGVLLEVGKGNVSRDDVLKRLTPDCHIKPGPTVPASGLFLVSVEYE
jgi:tRNA pseudouridine38-40 synthase